MASTGPTPRGISIGAVVAVVALAAAAALVFLLIWFVLPQYNHYLALATIGVLSLFLALGTTIGRAFTRADLALKMLSWGFVGLGFALLIGSLVLAGSQSIIGIVFELVGLVLVVILLAIVAGLAAWGSGSALMTQRREMQRAAWKASPPASAFDYTTARPNVPSPAPGAADGEAHSPPPGVRQ